MHQLSSSSSLQYLVEYYAWMGNITLSHLFPRHIPCPSNPSITPLPLPHRFLPSRHTSLSPLPVTALTLYPMTHKSVLQHVFGMSYFAFDVHCIIVLVALYQAMLHANAYSMLLTTSVIHSQ